MLIFIAIFTCLPSCINLSNVDLTIQVRKLVYIDIFITKSRSRKYIFTIILYFFSLYFKLSLLYTLSVRCLADYLIKVELQESLIGMNPGEQVGGLYRG